MGDNNAYRNGNYTELFVVSGRYNNGSIFQYYGVARSRDSAMKKVLRDNIGRKNYKNVIMIDAEPA